MNADLANSHFSIIIPLCGEPKKSEVADEMMQKFILIENVKYKTKEQILLLLCLAAS